jgi:hypothetical protein
MNATISAADLDVQILTVLGSVSQPKDRNQIAALILGVDGKRVGSRLAAMRKRGQVIQIAGGRGSNPATYVINRDV